MEPLLIIVNVISHYFKVNLLSDATEEQGRAFLVSDECLVRIFGVTFITRSYRFMQTSLDKKAGRFV